MFNPTLASPWGRPGRLLQLSDGALMWYTETGPARQDLVQEQAMTHKRPILLVHGWRVSSRFWLRNVPVLAGQFRVVTPDLRGHGSSTKILEGHTIAQYARDLHELAQALGLERPIIAGWSMAGSIMLEYWRQFGPEHVGAIALIDSCVAPFADGAWNAFRMKQGKSDLHSQTMRALRNDPENFARQFMSSMFGDVKATDEELDWMTDEVAKTPPWIATAIHTDFVARDYERSLPHVTVPLGVFAGEFGAGGLEMGRHFAQQAPLGRCYPYPHCGHLPFYEDAATFNAEFAAFCAAVE